MDHVHGTAPVVHCKGKELIFCGVIIIRGAVCQSSACRFEMQFPGTAWCNWNWVKRGVLNAGNVVDLECSLEGSGYVEIF